MPWPITLPQWYQKVTTCLPGAGVGRFGGTNGVGVAGCGFASAAAAGLVGSAATAGLVGPAAAGARRGGINTGPLDPLGGRGGGWGAWSGMGAGGGGVRRPGFCRGVAGRLPGDARAGGEERRGGGDQRAGCRLGDRPFRAPG